MRTRSRGPPPPRSMSPPLAPTYPDPPSFLPSSRRSVPRPRPAHLSPPLPPDPLAPSRRSDLVLRNLALLAFAAALALAFLNLALALATFFVGLLAPAWQTVKALEARRLSHPAPARPVPIVVDLTRDRDNDPDDPNDHSDDSDDNSTPAQRRERDANVVACAAEHALRNWQKYWVMAGLLFAADGMLRPVLTAVMPRPLYAAWLFSAVTWLTRNRGGNAAALYAAMVRPMFVKSERVVDAAVDKVLARVDGISSQMVVAVNQVVAPYARQLEHAAAQTRRHMQRQARGRWAGEFKTGRFLR